MLSSSVLLRIVSTPAVWLSWALDNPPGNAARRPAPGGTINQDGMTQSIAEHGV
jgi:hypothetical protein